MFSEVRTYSPEDVILSFGGYAVEDWDSISVSRTNPEFKVVKGIRGKNTRVIDQNTHSLITLTCPQTSLVNQILSSVIALDVESRGVRLEVSLSDVSGWEVFSSDEAYIRKSADRTYSSDMGTRVWEIECLTSRMNDSKRGVFDSSIFSDVMNMF